MNTSFSVALKYGLFIAISLIAYFLILRLFNLHENPWLRLLNGVAMCAGIYYAIKYYKLISGTNFSYINGMKTALITGFIATVIFTAFMSIYMFHLDPAFTEKILGEWFENYGTGAGILVFIILIEGLASTVVLSLAFMQLFKKSYNISQKA
ncbi:DUF4199 family protein [Psychroserpens algicola]|uniref:DUF4199 domain-containing protein n=1 Tax=Psychroserpens algicola TaxID=1719034 RepID=A0ABT0H7H3_9FLAO|nr:DUF4199 family protein [Psychroserpens algicola]MCK8480316.1 DUF4199 domain-containing protein [Psychroserpens algicola]